MKMSLFNIIAGLILIIPYVVICTPVHRHNLLDSSQQQQQQQQLQRQPQQNSFSMKNDDFPFGTIPSSPSLSGVVTNTGVSSRVESPLSMSSTPLLGGTRLNEDSDRSLLYEQQEMGTGQGAINGLRQDEEHGNNNFLQENSNELVSENEEDLNESHLDDEENGDNDLTEATSSMDVLKKVMDDIKNQDEVAIKSAYLMKLLQQPSLGPLPILYVENRQTDETARMNADKRSGRYYRRYPWKRQNGRYRTYEADTRYLCVPSREDVFKLLVGLHENRNGNHQKTVNFCNRKRPAKSIFTNIRFIG